MKKWITVVLLLVVAGGIAGCGSPGGPAPVGPGSPVHPYPLTITRTGGFAGVDESITLRADGSWSYSGSRGKPAAQGTLTPTELDQITRAVSDPAFPADVRPHRTEGTCNDGFTYSVTVGPETTSFEECGGNDRPLFTALLATLNQHTPF